MGPPGFIEQLPAAYHGLLLILLASLFAAGGIGMLRFGKKMLRGFRFLIVLAFRLDAEHRAEGAGMVQPGHGERRTGHLGLVR